jgi:hypothetical protein
MILIRRFKRMTGLESHITGKKESKMHIVHRLDLYIARGDGGRLEILEASTSWTPMGPVQACNGIALPSPYIARKRPNWRPQGKGKGTDFQLQALDRPLGFLEVEAPEFLDNRHRKAVRL